MKNSMLLTTVLLLAPATAAQLTVAPQEEEESHAARVEALRSRIHDMRMSLLLGGEKVQSAETEAIGFYSSKVETIDRGIDSMEVDLSEKRASYKVALEQTLQSEGATSRDSSMKRAQTLRSEIGSIEGDVDALKERRTNLNKLIGAVQARGREREALAGKLELAGGFEDEMNLNLGTVGLVPPDPVAPRTTPLEDDGFVADMMREDPRAASRILFESDPEGYWKRFPLQPPSGALQRALRFPLPDLPGQR